MPTVPEALASFERKASTARARYWKAIREGTTAREACRVHDETRMRAFNDLVQQVKDRQRELSTLLDEDNWTSLGDANAAPGHRAELEDGHVLTHGFGARVKLGRLWDVDAGPEAESSTRRSSNAAMNDLIRGG
jgi:hypothetical protein